MFRSRSPLSSRPTVSTRRLWLEALEERNCPSTFVPGNTVVDVVGAYHTQQSTNQYASQYVLNLSYTVVDSQTVEITGAVTPAMNINVDNQVVEFEGAINGYVVTDAGGYFDFTTAATCPATIDAAVVPEASNDGAMMPAPGAVQSNALETMLMANGTQITNLTITKMGPIRYQITGTVTGPNVAGLTVTFGGASQTVAGETAIVQANGTFTLLATMENGAADNGEITAQILSDANGQPSDVAYGMIFGVGAGFGGGGMGS